MTQECPKSSWKFCQFRRDDRGVAVVEFAFVFPVLLVLYFGTFQVCDAVSAYRKVTITTRAIADLTSQYSSVSDADLDTVLSASTQIMAPYSPGAAQMTVTQVNMDNSGQATVGWSRGLNTSGLIVGTPFTLPADIRLPNTSLIVSDMNFNYQSGIVGPVLPNIPFHDTIIMRPRISVSITKKAG